MSALQELQLRADMLNLGERSEYDAEELLVALWSLLDERLAGLERYAPVRVEELVDTPGSSPDTERFEGSSPSPRNTSGNARMTGMELAAKWAGEANALERQLKDSARVVASAEAWKAEVDRLRDALKEIRTAAERALLGTP